MAKDEDLLAAKALADVLSSAMLRAYEHKRALYIWEMDGLAWLVRFMDRRPAGPLNGWTCAFIRLNRERILAGNPVMDWNLASAPERM